jgi:glucose uptake protein
VYYPPDYATALVMMLISMLCWGSWPNFLKKLPDWRLEYFYIDYSLGFLITALVFGFTMGSGGPGEPGHWTLLTHAGAREAAYAIVGGFIWNFGNILLLIAIMIAGLAVAYPIAAVPAIVLGIGGSYWLQPVGNPWILGSSVVLLLVAAQVTAVAYRRLGGPSTEHRGRAIGIAVISGFLIGFFPPFVQAAIGGDSPLDSYTVSTLFMLGACAATAVAVPVLLRRPLTGETGTMSGYLKGGIRPHVFGLLAGVVWCIGTVFNYVSAGMVGVAISVGIGCGAPMIGALWGVFVWREFEHASAKAKIFITAAMLLYTAGVAAMSVAYTL